MKFSLLTILFLGLSFFCISQTRSVKDLIGKWEAKDAKGGTGGLQFLDETDRVRVTVNGVSHDCKYIIDFNKDPIWFDIITYTRDGTENKTVCLLKFLNDSTIKWQRSKSGKRFGDFAKNNGDDFILLHKKE